MAALGSRVWSPEDSLGRPVERATPTRAPAVIWGRNADTRLLLRGLLRLHRFPVLHEVSTFDEIVALPALSEPTVLVIDAEVEGQAWHENLRAVLAAHPELRPLVLLPPGNGALESSARTAGARAVVARPFAIRDFVRAVTAAAEPRDEPAPGT
jgi:DNA-binding NarL/FixJ family response regulator